MTTPSVTKTSRRHRSREIAFQFLYQSDILTKIESWTNPADMDASTFQTALNSYFEHFDVPGSCRDFVNNRVIGTLVHLEKIHAAIKQHTAHWRMDRMGLIERNILRIATYELLFAQDTPHSVAIDEAIELGKKFGSADTSSFLNGILDAIAKDQSLGPVNFSAPEGEPLNPLPLAH